MTAELKFVTLDGTTHVIGFSEYTVCMQPIPMGNTWTKDADSVCPDCRARVEGTDEFGAGELPAEKKHRATKEAKADAKA